MRVRTGVFRIRSRSLRWHVPGGQALTGGALTLRPRIVCHRIRRASARECREPATKRGHLMHSQRFGASVPRRSIAPLAVLAGAATGLVALVTVIGAQEIDGVPRLKGGEWTRIANLKDSQGRFQSR